MRQNKAKNFFSKATSLLVKETIPSLFIFTLFFLLTSCTTTDYQQCKDCVTGSSKSFLSNDSSSLSDSYRNASATAKGALIGGVAGAAVGGFTSGIGVLPGAAAGAIVGGSYGNYLDTKLTLEDLLAQHDVKTIILGDQILMVIPSEHLFEEKTANVKSSAYPLLRLVAIYICRYTKTLVRVAAYTDDTGRSAAIDTVLSQQQAEHVARILTDMDVNARLLYAEGNGSTHLVTRAGSNWASENYRIEISFEKLYV